MALPVSKGVDCIPIQATCTEKVQESIIRSLELKQPQIIKGSFNRPNIAYKVGTVLIAISKLGEQVDVVEIIRMYSSAMGRFSAIIGCVAWAG